MRVFFWIAFVGSFSIASAQVWKKGYLVDDSGKRTECLIKKEDWAFHPTRIVYKLDESSPEIIENNELAFSEIGLYDGVSYKRFTGDIEHSRNQARFYTFDREPKWQRETQLLRLLVKGKANLYVLIDGAMTKYFYETPNVPLVQLLHYSFLRTNTYGNQGSDMVYEVNRYRDELRKNLVCDALAPADFDRLTYKKQSLVKLFTKYNECSGSR